MYTVHLFSNFDLKQTGREEITFVKLKQTINEESNCLCKNNPTLYDDSTILNGSQSVTYCAKILFLFFFFIPRKEGEKKKYITKGDKIVIYQYSAKWNLIIKLLSNMYFLSGKFTNFFYTKNDL